jgi:hypothetical protein
VPSPSVLPSPSTVVAVLKIEQVGGMIGPSITLNRYPTVALYADGRLIMLGPQIELYPGPALPNLQVTQLTPAGVQQVLDWAAEAGLQGEDRFLGQPMPDAGTTLFTVVRGQETHTSSVADMSSDDQAIGALRQFQDVVSNIRQWLPAEDIVGDDQPYAWDALQILATPADPASMPDPALVTIVDWPLASLATIGVDAGGQRCAVIEGADLDTLRPPLETANELTMWRSDDQVYSVQLHPLLPDDPGCSGFAGP